MEKLVQNITRLLAQHNCVIVPGVGAFLAHKVPAFYSTTEKLFLPPRRALGFNPLVTIDDALLVSEYMSCGSLTFEEAGNAMADDIDRLRYRLSRKGIVRFGELGTFTMDIEGAIAFEPNENAIDDPYNYGFEPFAISQLSELRKRKDIVIKRKNISKYISIAAAAIVLIFVLVPIGNSIYNNNTQLSVAGFAPAEKNLRAADSSKPAEIAAKPVEKAIVPNVPDTIYMPDIATAYLFPANGDDALYAGNRVIVFAKTPPALADVPDNIENPTRYSIIVATVPDYAGATQAIAELSMVAPANYTIIENGFRYRIAIESYFNKENARKALNRVQAVFPQAWVFIHK